MNADNKEQLVECLLNWASNNLRCFEWRKGRTPYKILIAEFLLKRTTSKAASKIYSNFITKYPDIHCLANAEKSDIENEIKSIGLFKQRSKGFLEAANFVKENYNGRLPRTRERLVEIPHIGHYTAGCILSFGMNIPAYIVDSNVERILSRVFKNEISANPSHNTILQTAESLLPKKAHVTYNYALIDLGSALCTYRHCGGDRCPLKNCCDTYSELKEKIQPT